MPISLCLFLSRSLCCSLSVSLHLSLSLSLSPSLFLSLSLSFSLSLSLSLHLLATSYLFHVYVCLNFLTIHILEYVHHNILLFFESNCRHFQPMTHLFIFIYSCAHRVLHFLMLLFIYVYIHKRLSIVI